MFELKERDGLARIGILETSSGKIETPALLPVVNPNQILILPKELKARFKAEAIITNAYIIWKNPALREKCLEKGLHSALDFRAPIMTDSGTFQVYEYGDLKLDAKEIVDFQIQLGADLVTGLDVISPPDRKYEDAKKDVLETIKRAVQAVARKKAQLLVCAVQGGIYPDLREYCARELSKLDCDIFAIGGVVPLLESYRFEELVQIILSAKKQLALNKPVHLFGCGHPMVLPLAALLGCDLFDSASYAKYARREELQFCYGTRSLEELAYSPCSCPVCDKFEELKELDPAQRVKKIAEHNLYVTFEELKRVKQAIHENTLWELVEQRCSVHPSLLPVLRAISEHKEFLEKFDNLSRKSFFYTCRESLARPAVYRFRKRLLERYQKPEIPILIVLPESKKPYAKTYHNILAEVSKVTNAHFVVASPLGPVPIELDEIYPIAQSVIPKKIAQTLSSSAEGWLEKYVDNFDYSLVLFWEGKKTLEALKAIAEKNYFNLDLSKLKAVADLQFGKGAAKALFEGKALKIIKSRTGRIRNVLINNRHALSMRNDGFFTLKFEAGKLLHEFFPEPKLRVVVSNEAREFVKQGRNVFAKFVERCAQELRPGDEVLIVDRQDNLLAIGRALLNPQEMLAFKRGIAVRVRG